MNTLLSPGVMWKELDFSAYAVQLATSTFGTVGLSSKGTPGVPIQIFSATDMVAKVGSPNPSYGDYSLYAMDQYFKTGRNAWFIRLFKPTIGNTIASSTAKFVVQTTGSSNFFQINANSPGTYGNALAFSIVNVDTSAHEFDLVVLDVDSSGNQIEVERFEAMTCDSTKQRYIQRVLNDGINGVAPSTRFVISNVAVFANQDPDTYNMQNLSSGLDSDVPTASDYAGTSANSTGLYALQDSDSFDVNMIAVPGISDPAVITAIQDICENLRGDCFGIIDPPYASATPNDVISWRQSLSYSSSYTSMFWPWCKINDNYNNQKVWIPPSAFVAQRIAFSDNLTNPWIAFAGLNRGVLPGVLDIQYKTNQSERDALYNRNININTIKRDPGAGFVLWGNRTNLAAPSALNYINVRRMMLYLEKIIATTVKYLVFEPNDPVMWNAFTQMVTPVFQNVKDARGITQYSVLMDSTTNTSFNINNGKATGLMKVVPTFPAEKIELDFALFPAGATF